jgi:ferredoxin
MPWIPRGLRNGIVTSPYPRRSDRYDAAFKGTIDIRDVEQSQTVSTAAEHCPTQAITFVDGAPQLDRGKCILCGRCAEIAPDVFVISSSFETSAIRRRDLRIPDLEESDDNLRLVRDGLTRRVRSLRRSIHIRHVDAGSDGSDEWEIAALTNPVYDVQRLGIYFTASPRHADILLVTGVVTSGMMQPLLHTFDVIPNPKSCDRQRECRSHQRGTHRRGLRLARRGGRSASRGRLRAGLTRVSLRAYCTAS